MNIDTEDIGRALARIADALFKIQEEGVSVIVYVREFDPMVNLTVDNDCDEVFKVHLAEKPDES